jgi:hypothetical protein
MSMSELAQQQYKSFWGQLPVLPEQRAAQLAAQRHAMYGEGPAPKSLHDYPRSVPRSKWLPRPNQSDMDYVSRVKGWMSHLSEQLPAAEFEAVTVAFNAAQQRLVGGQSHAELRTELDSKDTGVGVGLFGQTPATDRAGRVGHRGFAGQQQLERNGLAGAATDRIVVQGGGAQQVSLSLFDRMPKQEVPYSARRTDTSTLQSSSEGWMVTR